MADTSKVLVRLQLLGGALFNREAKQAGRSLEGVGRGGRAAGAGVGSGGARATSALNRVQTATKRTSAEMARLHRSASNALSPIKRIIGMGAAAGGLGFAAAITDSANFEQAMANVQARLVGERGLEGSMSRLSKLALVLGARTQFSAGQAASAMGELAAQGFNANQIMRVLPGTLSLAAASGTDLANAAEIQTQTLHGFGLQASKAGVVADVLAQIANRSAASIDDMQEALTYIAPVAKASGQSLQDMGAAIGLMSNVGIKGSQAGTTLRTAMVRLSNPTLKARKALHTLHLSAGDLAGKKGLLSLPNIMGKISAGAQGVSKNQRNAAIATIFGREALSGMVALVEKGPKKLQRLSDALTNSRGAAKRAAGIMRNTVKGAFDNFTGSVETAAITLTKKYMPAIRHALNAGAGGINQFTAGLSTGRTTTTRTRFDERTHHKVTTQVAAPGAQRAGATVRNVISAAAAGAQRLAQQALPVIKDVVNQLIGALKPAMPFVRNVLLPLLKGIGEGVLASVVGAFKVAIPLIKITTTELGLIGRVAAPLKGVIHLVGVAIGWLAAGPILKALGAMGKVGIVFRLMRVPLVLVGGTARGLGRTIGLLGRAFGRSLTFVSRFAGTLTGAPRRIILGATNMIGGVIHVVETLPGRVAAIAGRVGQRLVSGIAGGTRGALSSLTSFFGRVGKAIIDAIVNVIKSAPGEITSAVMSVVPGPAKKAVKKALGIGKSIVPGIATGGTVRAGGWALVGERGPELARFPRGSTVYDHRQTARSMSTPSRPMPTMAAPNFPPIFLRFQPTLDGRVIHDSVHRIERARVEAT